MTSTFLGFCPRCDGERTCNILGAFEDVWDWADEEHSINGQDDHKLAQCAGCKTVFYHKSSWNSENWQGGYDPVTGKEIIFHPRKIETYPAPEKKSQKPDWVWGIGQIDPQLYTILDEVYQAYEVGSFILASVGLRTALDRTTEILKIDPSLSLEKKVKALQEQGYIGETEANTLSVVTDAGSAAAHRGWSPDQKAFAILITTLEQFIYRVVVTGKAALSLTEGIPARHPRPKKPAKPNG